MSHANPLKPNRIQQTLRRYFKRILPRPLAAHRGSHAAAQPPDAVGYEPDR